MRAGVSVAAGPPACQTIGRAGASTMIATVLVLQITIADVRDVLRTDALELDAACPEPAPADDLTVVLVDRSA